MSAARNGKRAVNDWAKLPPEVLRLVVTNYLAYNPQAVTPNAWIHGEFYYQRAIYDILRDAYLVQRLMRVCPQWHGALATMDIWTAGCRALDRMDYIRPKQHEIPSQGGANAVVATRIVHDYDRFYWLCQLCCIPCRINRPKSNEGIGNAKSLVLTQDLGYVYTCKSHRNTVMFCGVCLKEQPLASRGDHREVARVPESLFVNEDHETWPNIHITCYHCRRQALIKSVQAYSGPAVDLFEFIGGYSLECDDYEARSTLDGFIEMAEGGVNDVLGVLLERHWLRTNTPLDNLLAEAVASVRLVKDQIREMEGPGYESEEDMLSDDDESSYDMLQSHEESGIRSLAVSAWARSRIMDGNWVTPNDMWHSDSNLLPIDPPWNPSYNTPTIHPIPHYLHSADDPTSSAAEQPVHYPNADRPAPFPTYRFMQIVSNCFRSVLHDILFDPMHRIAAVVHNQARFANRDPCLVYR
ncbi:hypothetical protein M422DRAFT_26794 [Sphaerobolus stellatus SS14]|nr:hypothetical protein M422DRAFT_26794 [Sphaerobolus stellatus SS14]